MICDILTRQEVEDTARLGIPTTKVLGHVDVLSLQVNGTEHSADHIRLARIPAEQSCAQPKRCERYILSQLNDICPTKESATW